MRHEIPSKFPYNETIYGEEEKRHTPSTCIYFFSISQFATTNTVIKFHLYLDVEHTTHIVRIVRTQILMLATAAAAVLSSEHFSSFRERHSTKTLFTSLSK